MRSLARSSCAVCEVCSSCDSSVFTWLTEAYDTGACDSGLFWANAMDDATRQDSNEMRKERQIMGDSRSLKDANQHTIFQKLGVVRVKIIHKSPKDSQEFTGGVPS